MDIKQQMMITGVGEPLLEFARDGAIGRANIAMYNLAEYILDVGNLSQLVRAPVVQQCCALLKGWLGGAELPWVVFVMEGEGVKPKPVDGSPYTVVFFRCQESATLVIVLPLLEGVYCAPLLRNSASVDDILEQRR